MNKQICIMAALTGCLAQTISAQQAWTRPKGTYYAQVGFSRLGYNALLNGSQHILALGRTVSDVTLQGYVEYGLTHKILLSASIPYKIVSVDAITHSNLGKIGDLSAFSNLQANVSIRFYQKNGWVLTGKGSVSLPTAQYDAATGLRTGFDATSYSPSLLAGVGHKHFFASAEMGYAYRTNGHSERYFLNAQIGRFWDAKKRFLTILAFERVMNGKKGTFQDANATWTGLYLQQQTFAAPHIKISYKLNPKLTLWLTAATGIHAYSHDVGASNSLSINLSYQK